MRDEQSDACTCLRCRDGKPMVHVARKEDLPTIRKAIGGGLRLMPIEPNPEIEIVLSSAKGQLALKGV